MSRARRLTVVVAAWVAPAAWILVAVFSGPSDGTTISPPTALLAEDRWGDTVTVTRAYGGTPLREGDLVLTVDGRRPADAVPTAPDSWATGDVVRYRVRRSAVDLDRILELEVTLVRYPLAAAAGDNLPLLALAVLGLAVGSLAFWQRPGAAATRATLVAASLAPATLVAYPFGLGAIDLGDGHGLWRHLTAELLGAAAVGAVLVVALTLSAPGRRPLPLLLLPAFAVPATGYAVWAITDAARQAPGPARWQSLACVAAPALAVAAPTAVVLLVHHYRQAAAREDRLALRLVLLVVAGGVGARLLLVDLPRQLSGRALLPDGLLVMVLVPALLGCLLVALLHFRLDDIEPGVRRTLVQVLVVALVGTAFATAARAVGLAAETSFASMVAGGVLALLLVPVAVGLQRTLRRLVYGDRAASHRVVSELRRLDPLSDPPAILEETLHLLSRRLHLSAAAIEVTGPGPADHVAVAVGSRRGRATTVDLAVGDTRVGRLELEVHPDRDPFGPADRRLLEDVGQQVGTLVQAVSINRRLQHSRQALVTAREEERRRVRRDLHDGLGPSLATLALRLESARDLIATDPVGASDEVGELAERVRAQIAEVRRLVDGLRPPVLDQLGLRTALRQRSAEHRVATARDEKALAWTVCGDEDLGPLPAAVEVAAYWIAVEAVTNAVRHSAGHTCTVTLHREPAALRVVVRDDGTGLPEGVSPGVGLSSMRERAEEVGGTCTLTSTPGRGTVVEARLPLSVAGSAR